jgi:proteasome lid subunit RPN8/RPN11
MSSAAALRDCRRLVIDDRQLGGTWHALQKFGAFGCEGLVLWLGTTSGLEARVTEFVVPPQHPICDETGVGYFVDGATLSRLNRYLYETGSVFIAQVHSHPGPAYHSEADDRYALVTEEGGFSLVVPEFATHPPLMDCALYRLTSGAWEAQTAEDGIHVRQF